MHVFDLHVTNDNDEKQSQADCEPKYTKIIRIKTEIANDRNLLFSLLDIRVILFCRFCVVVLLLQT